MRRIISGTQRIIISNLQRLVGAETNHWLVWDLMHGFRYHAIWDYASVRGWLSPREAKCLFDLSASITTKTPVIVEIGSWMGQSSIILAKGIGNSLRGKVYCIDPFDSAVASVTDEMRDQAHKAASKQAICLMCFRQTQNVLGSRSGLKL